MLAAGGGELAQCFRPLVARGVRADGTHAQRFTGAVDYGVFHAVAQAGSGRGWSCVGGCGEQNIAQVGGEHLGRVLCGGRVAGGGCVRRAAQCSCHAVCMVAASQPSTRSSSSTVSTCTGMRSAAATSRSYLERTFS